MPERKYNCKSIFVGGIAGKIDKEALKKIFSNFGDVTNVEIPKKKPRGGHRRYCFVNFRSSQGPHEACKPRNIWYNGALLRITKRFKDGSEPKIQAQTYTTKPLLTIYNLNDDLTLEEKELISRYLSGLGTLNYFYWKTIELEDCENQAILDHYAWLNRNCGEINILKFSFKNMNISNSLLKK